MAIQTRQQANGRMVGLGRIVSVTFGTVALGAALVAGGLGWQHAHTAQTPAGVLPMEQHALGIDLPQGADVAQLPRGMADYIRPSTSAPQAGFPAPALGISLSAGTNLRELPRGLTDYVRPQPAASVDMQLGIDLPQGADVAQLPRGMADNVRLQSAKGAGAAPSAILGITLPSGTQRSDLPRGITDYVRPNQ